MPPRGQRWPDRNQCEKPRAATNGFKPKRVGTSMLTQCTPGVRRPTRQPCWDRCETTRWPDRDKGKQMPVMAIVVKEVGANRGVSMMAMRAADSQSCYKECLPTPMMAIAFKRRMRNNPMARPGQREADASDGDCGERGWSQQGRIVCPLSYEFRLPTPGQRGAERMRDGPAVDGEARR